MYGKFLYESYHLFSFFFNINIFNISFLFLVGTCRTNFYKPDYTFQFSPSESKHRIVLCILKEKLLIVIYTENIDEMGDNIFIIIISIYYNVLIEFFELIKFYTNSNISDTNKGILLVTNNPI